MTPKEWNEMAPEAKATVLSRLSAEELKTVEKSEGYVWAGMSLFCSFGPIVMFAATIYGRLHPSKGNLMNGPGPSTLEATVLLAGIAAYFASFVLVPLGIIFAIIAWFRKEGVLIPIAIWTSVLVGITIVLFS